MCNLSKEKCLIFLFHSLTLSLCFSLSLQTAPPEALTCVFLTMAEWLSCFSSSLKANDPCLFASFFSFFLQHVRHALHHFSLREVKPFPCFGPFTIDDAEKSPMSHTVFACSQQHLHNKKRRSYKEHRCGTG